MALTKVSGGILDPGINVAGIVTATGFDGLLLVVRVKILMQVL